MDSYISYIMEFFGIFTNNYNSLSLTLSDDSMRDEVNTKLDHVREEYKRLIDNINEPVGITILSRKLIGDIKKITGYVDNEIYNNRINIYIDYNTYSMTDHLMIGRSEYLRYIPEGIYIRSETKPYKISRMHAIILVISDVIFVIDPGSYNGIQTLYRSNGSNILEHSTVNNRKNLMFNINESIKLLVGKYELWINKPTEENTCPVCYEYPKNVILNCGHKICNICSKLLHYCPDDRCKNKIVLDKLIMIN